MPSLGLTIVFGVCFAMMRTVPLIAQDVPPAQCDSAAAAVTGRPLPAVNDSTFSAWYALVACGDVGETAAVQALQSSAVYAETDSTRVRVFFNLFYARRTTAFFNALQAVVLNSGTSAAFRRQAIRAYGGLYLPGYDFDPPPPTADGISCGVSRLVITAAGPVSNLPSNFLTQMVTTMSAVASNAGNAADSRYQAQCWTQRLQMDIPPVASKIQLAYVCGQRFLITNSNTAPVLIAADVIPPNATEGIEHAAFTVQPGAAFTFATLKRGTVRISFNGSVVQTKPNGGTACH